MALPSFPHPTPSWWLILKMYLSFAKETSNNMQKSPWMLLGQSSVLMLITASAPLFSINFSLGVQSAAFHRWSHQQTLSKHQRANGCQTRKRLLAGVFGEWAYYDVSGSFLVISISLPRLKPLFLSVFTLYSWPFRSRNLTRIHWLTFSYPLFILQEIRSPPKPPFHLNLCVVGKGVINAERLSIAAGGVGCAC